MRTETGEIDFEIWGRMPYWTVDEAIALVSNVDPLQTSSFPYSNEQYNVGLSHLMQRAIEVNRLTDPIDPLLFMEWMNQNGLPAPKLLLEAVAKFHGASVNWKAMAERERARLEKSEAAFEHYMNLAAKRNLRIEELETEVAALQERVKNSSDTAKLGSLQRSMNSLLKLVGGMAIAAYGFNPHERRSSVVKQIQGDLDLKGIQMDEDTIRKWLKEGGKVAMALSV